MMSSGCSSGFEESASQVLSQASALLFKMKKCVSRCQSIPASVYWSELRCIKKEMFRLISPVAFLHWRYESTWNVFVPISGVDSPEYDIGQ